ncbi:chemotaxis protein CheB [Endozoicomonas montiporae]|nr:chemotaxis protein CheB [Endozoicomonas montiporae]AMO55121.1 MCP-glutamate methylesterase (CheB) [Endozoicomonas montiporae CL-33]
MPVPAVSMVERLVVIGASAGGFSALQTIFSGLGTDFDFPILVCKHLGIGDEKGLVDVLASRTGTTVMLSQDKLPMYNGCIYMAPGNYHLQVESRDTISLSIDERICHSRPAVDVLFESAADVFKDQVTAVVLTGANSDGAAGVEAIKNSGGKVVVQSLDSAEVKIMPKAAIETGCVDEILDLEDIAAYLRRS